MSQNNWDLIENNELSKNALGGTELILRDIYDGTIPRNLLQEFQIIPSRVRELKEDKIRIFAANDLPEENESIKFRDVELRNKFHKFVFNSNWQYQRYQLVCGMPYESKSTVIPVGIEPAIINTENKILLKQTNPQIDLAYISTPHRGLEILVPVFKKLAVLFPNIHLHVHSSFKIYGWDERDAQYEHLFEECRNHPQITYHGYTEHSELIQALNSYDILAYPCIWLETACKVLAEAMSAGMVCVHPAYGALPETSGCLNPFMYDGDITNIRKHAEIFESTLLNCINSHHMIDSFITRRYINDTHNKNLVLLKWKMLLEDLLKQYPTPESRKFSRGLAFQYKT